MINGTIDFIKHSLELKNPKTAIILGSGLSGFASKLENTKVLKYKDIEGFPESTVVGHKGELIKGYIGSNEILCLNGRFHLYEGHSPRVIADVMHILKKLGIERLIVTNASGSLRKDFAPGSLMLISDHINFSGKNPLVGPNDDKRGPRFPSMNNAYTLSLRQKIKEVAKSINVELKEGVYLMVLGPNFETSAEVRAFGILGADAVGMSTVPEVISASYCGMEVLGISVITNYAAGLVNNTPSHQETLSEASKASDKLVELVTTFLNIGE
jgi:inosine/guanosine/xanthosine phosphorylase family protein